MIPAMGSKNGGGNYFSGAINMLCNVNLYVETGATIKFVRNPINDYYPVVLTSHEGTDFYNYSPAVYALNQTKLGISGGGTLDFQVNVATWRLPTGVAGAPSGSNSVLNNWNYQDIPLNMRIMSDTGRLPATIPVISGDTVVNCRHRRGCCQQDDLHARIHRIQSQQEHIDRRCADSPARCSGPRIR